MEYPFRFDPEHARANAIAPFPKELGTDLDSYIAQHTAWNNRFADIIHNDFDPPTAFIRAGHQQGMKVYAWIEPKLEPLLKFWADVTPRHGFDGIAMHEAWTFEHRPGSMSLLRAMTQRMKAE